MMAEEDRQGLGWGVWVRRILGLRGAVAGAVCDEGLVVLDGMDREKMADDAGHSETAGRWRVETLGLQSTRPNHSCTASFLACKERLHP